MRLSFVIPGIPVPQGSKRIGRSPKGKPIILDDNRKTKPWKDAAIVEIKAGNPRRVAFLGPVVVTAIFLFQTKERKKWLSVRDTKPDLDKLQRALGDALEAAGVIENDSRIVAWLGCPAKRWVRTESCTHVVVEPYHDQHPRVIEGTL